MKLYRKQKMARQDMRLMRFLQGRCSSDLEKEITADLVSGSIS